MNVPPALMEDSRILIKQNFVGLVLFHQKQIHFVHISKLQRCSVHRNMLFSFLIQAYLILFYFSLLCFTDSCVFLQIKGLWQPSSSKSISTIFPTTFAHFISLYYILVILSIFKFLPYYLLFSLFLFHFYLLW